MTEIVFQRLLALVNSALWDKKTDEKLFAGMDDKMWDDLYHFAVRHGVMAIAFDGVKRLPSDLQPYFKLRMTWGLGLEHIEQKYAHIMDVSVDLTTMFQKEQINMLILKGLSIANYYPVPARREFGDIDIYLFGDHKKGDLLMSKAGARKKNCHSYKHSSYYYKNVMIENHAYFLNVRDTRNISNLNQILLDILNQNEKSLKPQENGLLFPPSDFTALFLIIHAIRHLSKGALPLRTFCDWVLFLQVHAAELDTGRWKKTLQDAGILEISEVLTTLAFRWIGSSSETPFPVESHADMENRISKEMLQPLHSCKNMTRLQIFFYKCKRFHIDYKRHMLFYGGNPFTYYLRSVLSSSISHIRHPETIFKTI